MEYILHIGMPKTGSTSLQRALFDNRESLRQHGVICPITGTGNRGIRHNVLRHVLWNGRTPESVGMPVDWIERFRSEIADGEICILSDEVLSLQNLDPEVVTTLIPRKRTRVVMYVREPVAHTVSMYKQRIEHQLMTESLRDFAGYWCMPYLSAVERWSRVFGRRNVILRWYRRDQGSWDIVSDFAETIGLNKKDAFPSLEYRDCELNLGISGNLLFLKRMLNKFITHEENKSIKYEIEEIKYLDKSFHGKIPVDQHTVNLIANQSKEQLQGLNRFFGLSIIPHNKAIDAPPCPDQNSLAHDFARVQTWARDRKGTMAPLLDRLSGKIAKAGAAPPPPPPPPRPPPPPPVISLSQLHSSSVKGTFRWLSSSCRHLPSNHGAYRVGEYRRNGQVHVFLNTIRKSGPFAIPV